MSDTPETDAVVAEMSEWTRPFISEKYDCITLESPIVAICRKLERERDEWRKAAFETTAQATKLKKELLEAFHADQTQLLLERNQLLESAKNIVARWELPVWKDAEPTAVAIYKLRDVIENIQQNDKSKK